MATKSKQQHSLLREHKEIIKMNATAGSEKMEFKNRQHFTCSFPFGSKSIRLLEKSRFITETAKTDKEYGAQTNINACPQEGLSQISEKFENEESRIIPHAHVEINAKAFASFDVEKFAPFVGFSNPSQRQSSSELYTQRSFSAPGIRPM